MDESSFRTHMNKAFERLNQDFLTEYSVEQKVGKTIPSNERI